VAFAAALLVYEHALVHRRGLAAIDRAFFDVNAWVSVAFFAMVLADELLRRFVAA
jgi:4-hydroxybenzoate polyprenyltransferase